MILKINGTIPTTWPITAPFGSIDPAHPHPHPGVDFGINLGTPVPSMTNGTVEALTNEGSHSFGQAVHIRLDNGDEVIYGHLSEFKCKIGQEVHQGDIIALSGSTGQSTGPHLHIQVMHHNQAIDPMAYFGEYLNPFQNGIHTTTNPSISNQISDALAQKIGDMLQIAARDVGIFIAHALPGTFETLTLMSIIGAMIGSNRCKHLIGTFTVATIIGKVVSNSV